MSQHGEISVVVFTLSVALDIFGQEAILPIPAEEIETLLTFFLNCLV